MLKKIVLFVLFTAVALSLAACDFTLSSVRGSGDIVTIDYDVSDFEGVELNGVGDLVISQGDEESLTLTTDDNIAELFTADVRGDTLVIEFERQRTIPMLDATDGIRFDLTVTDLSAVDLNGAGRIELQELETTSLRLVLDGAGDIDINDITADQLTVELNGAGDINASGSVESQSLQINGLGSYNAEDLESEDASVNLAGGGSVRVWATETLDIRLSGAGNLIYFGDPRVSENITGAGNVEHRER